MTVKTMRDAWSEVHKIFPYDYKKDEHSSERAWYDIYRATASEHQNNWISDLGNSLEVNFENGKTVRIYVEVEELHHYDVEVYAKNHVFTFQCTTIYEALEAVVDAGNTFKFEVDANAVMVKLVKMETKGLISFENHKFGMLDRVSDKLDKRESSLIWDSTSSAAIEFQILYIELDTLIRDSYGDTAAREFLILLCADRGITPEEATNTILKGEFTPTDIDVTGQRFNIGDVNYVVTEHIAAGQYQVMCETPGIIGNQYLGQMIPMEYIDGLQTATLTEILIPGEDEEDTEALRQRYFDSFNEQSFGGNRAAYIEAVKKINGVGDLKLERVWNSDIRPAEMIPSAAVTNWYNGVIGTLDAEVATWLTAVYMAALAKKLTVGGTVLVVIVDSDDFGEASNTLIQTVQDELDPVETAGEGYGLAPIGHIVTVQSADAVTIDVKVTVTFDEGYNWTNLQTSIREAVDAYLLELRQEWSGSTRTIVRISQVESRILAVEGVADVANTKLNGSTNNLTLDKYEVPVIGGVSA